MMHRLVAEIFVKNSDLEKNIAVNHIDGDKTNNNASNLEWVTYSENQKHAYRNGLNSWNPSKGKPSKRVVQLDLETEEIIAIHDSIGSASRFVGAKYSSGISRCCNNHKRYKSAYGYKWKFQNDIESEE